MRSRRMEVRMAELVRKMEDVLRAERARRQKASLDRSGHQHDVFASRAES